MRLISLSCDDCGGPLEVPLKTRFVTCGFCGARLTIEQSGNAHYTKVVERIDQTTQQIARDVKDIKDQLDALDRDWESKKQKYRSPRKPDELQVAGLLQHVAKGTLGCIVGCLAMVAGARFGSAFWNLAGLMVVVVSEVSVWRGFKKHRRFQQEQRAFQQHRRQLMFDLDGDAESPV